MVLRNRRPPRTSLFKLSLKPAGWALELRSTTEPPWLSELFLFRGFSAFQREKEGLAQIRQAKN